MRAWLLDRFNGLSQLHVATTPDPVPAAGEVVLDLRCAALNPADRYLSVGQYPAKPPLPHVLGRDGCGIVSAVGAGVAGIHVGDRKTILRGGVGVSQWGTLAEKVAAPLDSLADAPADWSDAQAGSAALVYLTAHQALTQWGDLPPSVVLITGASGGVGVASLHLACALGHTVVALSRGTSKRQALLDLGAAAVLDPSDSAWRQQLTSAFKGKRVDLAIDNVGGALFSEVVDSLGEQGRISVVGRLAGPVPQFNTSSLLFRRLRVGGVSVGSYTRAESQAAWTSIVATLQRAGVQPLVDSTFGFDEVPAAFARLEKGPLGKVVIQISR